MSSRTSPVDALGLGDEAPTAQEVELLFELFARAAQLVALGCHRRELRLGRRQADRRRRKRRSELDDPPAKAPFDLPRSPLV
jgi:hypothetical protein